MKKKTLLVYDLNIYILNEHIIPSTEPHFTMLTKYTLGENTQNAILILCRALLLYSSCIPLKKACMS